MVCSECLLRDCQVRNNAIKMVEDSAYNWSTESIYPYDVTITRQENEPFFGLTIRVNRAEVNIGSIMKGYAADRCGQLRVGDRILAVNNINILNTPFSEVIKLVKESGYSITFTIAHPQQDDASSTTTNSQLDDQYHAIELHRGTKRSGLRLLGGKDLDMPLFVSQVFKNEPAHVDGKLMVGDQIIQINGENTKSMTHAQAIELMRQGNNTVRLLINRRKKDFAFVQYIQDAIKRAMMMDQQDSLRENLEQTILMGLRGLLELLKWIYNQWHRSQYYYSLEEISSLTFEDLFNSFFRYDLNLVENEFRDEGIDTSDQEEQSERTVLKKNSSDSESENELEIPMSVPKESEESKQTLGVENGVQKTITRLSEKFADDPENSIDEKEQFFDVESEFRNVTQCASDYKENAEWPREQDDQFFEFENKIYYIPECMCFDSENKTDQKEQYVEGKKEQLPRDVLTGQELLDWYHQYGLSLMELEDNLHRSQDYFTFEKKELSGYQRTSFPEQSNHRYCETLGKVSISEVKLSATQDEGYLLIELVDAPDEKAERAHAEFVEVGGEDIPSMNYVEPNCRIQ